VSLFAIIIGTFLGGILTETRGLGPALWISGLLQIVSNLGYAVVAEVGVNRPVMYGAQSFEYLTTGMGNGAFGVLLLRLTQKRFSATQYALLSTLFSIPRVLAGPPAAILADSIGWRNFFISTLLAGIPGLVMLQRFVPWGVREVEFHVPEPSRGEPLGRLQILLRGIAWSLAAGGAGLVTMALLAALKAYRKSKVFDLGAQLMPLLRPQNLGEGLTLAGVVLLALAVGLGAAATLVARRGIREAPEA
jgi:PAT family beta-lactamase induction signal transducer AmpG